MIISASRRTDIPAFYSEWFLNRIKERYVLVPNPYNPNMISRVSLDPAVIDCVVFWTKNPAPMIDKLDRLQNYKYYFQFTLNPYGTELESKLPPLQKRIDTFKRLSDKIGREKVVWRYDPILTNEQYTVTFHQDKFAEMAFALHDYTEKCMLGFIDHYPHVRASLREFHIEPLIKEDIDSMAISFKKTADECSMELDTCTTKVDLSHWGISSGVCVDNRLIERLSDILLLPVKIRISGKFAVVWKVLTSALMKAASMAVFIAMPLKVIIIRRNLTRVNTIRILRC